MAGQGIAMAKVMAEIGAYLRGAKRELCSRCTGVGSINSGGRYVICPRCEGVGEERPPLFPENVAGATRRR